MLGGDWVMMVSVGSSFLEPRISSDFRRSVYLDFRRSTPKFSVLRKKKTESFTYLINNLRHSSDKNLRKNFFGRIYTSSDFRSF